jgi:hypothetical protein
MNRFDALKRWTWSVFIVFTLAFAFAGCEGDTGPQGPALMALMGLMALMALMALMDLRERESVEARLMSPTRQRLRHWPKPATSSWQRSRASPWPARR